MPWLWPFRSSTPALANSYTAREAAVSPNSDVKITANGRLGER